MPPGTQTDGSAPEGSSGEGGTRKLGNVKYFSKWLSSHFQGTSNEARSIYVVFFFSLSQKAVEFEPEDM